MTSAQPPTNFSRPTPPEVLTPASQHWQNGSASIAQRSIGTTRRSRPPCSTRPHNTTPKDPNDGAHPTTPTTATTPSAAYAMKTVTYDAISKSTKNTFGVSPSKTKG